MNALVSQQFGTLSTKFAGQVAENDLGAGIAGGYGVIKFKGKVWSIHYKGNDVALMRDDGDGPRNSIEVVILKASQHISKVWYAEGYKEGSTAKPDCFSANGVTPDPASTKKQANVCLTCPKNAFGSGLNQDGSPSKGKACSDSKRLAVVWLNDLDSEVGPMLLRVPASSLNAIATYGMGVQKLGFPYQSIGTRIAFDPADAYPKFVLSPIRPLNDAEAEKVLALLKDPRIDRVLAEEVFEAAAPALAPPAQPAMAFEQPPKPELKPSPRKAKAPAAAQVNTTVAPQTVTIAPPPTTTMAPPITSKVTAPTGPAPTAFDDALDAEIEALMGKTV